LITFSDFFFNSKICFELTGKKSESVKLPLQSMKKKALGVTADMEQNVKTAQNSKKGTVGSVAKDMKVSEKGRRSDEVDKERKSRHHDRTKHLHHTKSQNSKALVKDTMKRHRIVDVNPQNTQTKKLDYQSDLLPERSVPISPDGVKKIKLYHTDRKLDETHVETKLYGHSLVEYEKKGNSGGLQHCSRKEQRDESSRVQLVDTRERVDVKDSKKSNTHVKTVTGDTADRGGGRAGMDQNCNKESARQHVRRGLYRALSSR